MQQDVKQNGVLSSTAAGLNALVAQVEDHAGALIQIGGTFVATLVPEVSLDGNTWVLVNAVPVGGTAPVTSFTAAGLWRVAIPGVIFLRVRMSSYTSGSAFINIKTTDMPQLAAGGGAALANPLQGSVALADGVSGALATVAQFHNSDQQNIGAGNGLYTGGVAQMLDPINGLLDRQRETGIDNIPANGITTGAAQFYMQGKTSSTGNLAAGTRTYTPAAMSGTPGGVPWSIQVGSVLIVDSGASQETVRVTAVTATTFTAVFAQAHNGSVTAFPIVVGVYNQERDAAGELDGASGSGTAVAAEYEYNSGGPAAGFNFDRARNLQGKGLGSSTISSGGGSGSTSVVFAAAVGLQPGAPVYFLGGTFEVAYVDKSYTGGTTVPLASALVNTHANSSAVNWDIYTANGPGISGFLPTGVGIEEEALWDPVSALFYIERSATQDGVSAQNVVMEGPALWNGATMDRGRSGSAANLSAQSGIGAEITTPPGQWSVFSTPAAATQATASKAAGGAGVRHICTSISATLATVGTAQTAIALNLRDGATGAGTIVWSKQVVLPTNGLWEVNLPGVNIPGSAATAMTLEFAAAGVAASVESVAMTGYDAS